MTEESFAPPRQPRLKAIGEQFAARRKDLKLSQRKLSEISGIEQPRLCKFETGQQNLTTLSLLRLADHLGLELAFAVKKEEATEAEPQPKNKCINFPHNHAANGCG